MVTPINIAQSYDKENWGINNGRESKVEIFVNK